MKDYTRHAELLSKEGFTIIENIYSPTEVNNILSNIERADKTKDTFRKSTELFAIRQFFKEIPELIQPIFTDKLKQLVQRIFGEKYFVVKSIYFDKPETSNWFVSYHQDLTISVDTKIELDGFGPWTLKQNQFSVQPPIGILQNIFTIRIHLDDTDKENGALKVIPKSHARGIYRTEAIDWTNEEQITCDVKKGGLMIMKPLLLHSSGRTTNNKRRRVIHIEFSNRELPTQLKWSERLT